MGPLTIVFGIVLVILGVVGYFASGGASVTALIPAFFGLPLLLLGFLARQENLRKHAMHAAVLVGLVGFLGAAFMAIPKAPELFSTGKVLRVRDGVESDATLGVIMQLLMALTCAVFVVLCVKSFIDARRNRASAAAASSTPS
jgi:hypothetical protein